MLLEVVAKGIRSPRSCSFLYFLKPPEFPSLKFHFCSLRFAAAHAQPTAGCLRQTPSSFLMENSGHMVTHTFKNSFSTRPQEEAKSVPLKDSGCPKKAWTFYRTPDVCAVIPLLVLARGSVRYHYFPQAFQLLRDLLGHKVQLEE